MRLFHRLRCESDEFVRLDLLRFIASFGIVFLHFKDRLGLAPELSLRLDGLSLFVDLFFVISGIVIARVYGERVGSLKGYGRFLKARVARLIPLHWATLAFYVTLGLASAAFGLALKEPGKYHWGCVVPSLLLYHATESAAGRRSTT